MGPTNPQRCQRGARFQRLGTGSLRRAGGGGGVCGHTQEPTLQTFYSGFGPGYGGWYWGGWGAWNGGYANTRVVYTPIGSLTVDIFNNHDKHLIWRSVSTQALSAKPAKNERKLADAVDKMFRNFPPPSRG